MANTTIDTLEVKITASAQSATKSLRSLSDALVKVKKTLSDVDKDGLKVTDQITKSLNEMNGALNTVTTNSIKKLQKLANALNAYVDAAQKFKGIGVGKSISQSIKNTDKALQGSKLSEEKPKEEIPQLDFSKLAIPSVGQSEIVTRMTDAWKKFGTTVKSALSSAKSALEKFGKAAKEAGKKIKSMSIFSGSFIKSIGRIALYRAIRSALKAVSEAFSEGLKNAYQYSKQSETFTRLAETLDHLKSIVAQMTNQIGAFFGEFKQLIAPAVNWLIEKVREISERLTELFAALNGEKTYLQAQFVAQEWEEASDGVKKYKQQLLGLDELNNLSSEQKKSSKKEVDYSTLYKEVAVSERMLKIGEQWNALKEKITGALSEIELALGGFMVGVGAVLLFSGANIPLGLGLIVAGGFMAYKAIQEKWDKLGATLEEKIGAIETTLGGFLIGIGAVLAFSGANIPLGIGLMIAGGTLFGIGEKKLHWTRLDKRISKYVGMIEETLGGLLIGVGAVIAFSGANIPLGIGLMISGGALFGVGEATLHWDELNSTLATNVGIIETTLGGLMIGVGSIIAFSGANIPLGIGLMIAGGTLFGEGEKELHWDELNETLQQKISEIELTIGGFLLGIGTVIAFSGVNLPLGIAMMASGAVSLANGTLHWDALSTEVQQRLVLINSILSAEELFLGTILTLAGYLNIGIPLMAIGAASAAGIIALNWDTCNKEIRKTLNTLLGILYGFFLPLGIILALSGVNLPLGIALISVGAAGLVTAIAFNWDAILQHLKDAFDRIQQWFMNTVVPWVEAKVEWLNKKLLHLRGEMDEEDTKVTTPVTGVEIQLNPIPGIIDSIVDTDLGDTPQEKYETRTEKVGSKIKKAWDKTKQIVSDTIDDIGDFAGDIAYDFKNSALGEIVDAVGGFLEYGDPRGTGFATGGIPTSGHLFYAGEAGPEFVGRIGNNSAVANTGQMTDAIYKAAYMGMSQALRENGNGMSGFVPATTDDLFIAMKKKASRYNKATGNPAFA